MAHSPTESHIVETLRKQGVEKYARLAQKCRVSTKTVQRALAKAGYFTSLNRNGTFVTLQQTSRFDDQGLRTHRQVCFSRHGNLRQTIQALVHQAPDGRSLQELESQLGTRVHNHVSQLIRDQQLSRCFVGRQVIYLSADGQRRARQQAARQQAARQPAAEPSPPAAARDHAVVPPGLDAATVIYVLVQLLETPQASVARVARTLQARQSAVRAEQVRQILEFYDLKKTTR